MSIQERLQLKRIPLDTWNLREQLCLASAVARSGDQNWMSVSRALKTVCDPNRPADWYSQKSCAAQYGALLEHVETPKRKKRNSEGAVETPQESILKRLTQERMAEIQKTVAELNQQYQGLMSEVTEVRNPATSEDRLRELWTDIENAKRTREREQARRAAWLREREEKRARAQRPWRPESSSAPSTPTGTAPPSSPLLTSLLKSSPVVTTPQHISHPANVVDTVSPSAGAPTLSMLLEKGSGAGAEHAAIEHIKSQLVQIERQYNATASACASPSTVPLVSTSIVSEPTVAPPTPATDKIEIDDIEIKAEDVYAFSDIDFEIAPVSTMHKNIVPSQDKGAFMKKEDDASDQDGSVEIIPEHQVDTRKMQDKQQTAVAADSDEVLQSDINSSTMASESSESQGAPAEQLPEVKISFPEVKFPTPEIKVIEPEVPKTKEELMKEADLAKPRPEVQRESKEQSPVLMPAGRDIPSTTLEEVGNQSQPEPEVTIEESKEQLPEIPQPLEPIQVEELKISDEVADAGPSKEEPYLETATKEQSEVVETKDKTSETESNLQQETEESTEQKTEEDTIDIKKELIEEQPTPAEREDAQEVTDSQCGDSGVAAETVDDTPNTIDVYTGEPENVDTNITIKKEKEMEEIHTETDDDTPMELIREEEKDGKKKRDYSRKKKPDSRTCSGSESAAEASAPDSPAAGAPPHSEAEREHRLWKKSVMLVYNRLCAHKYASLFLRPITDEQAPGYSAAVRRPMDLGTIKRNIDSGLIRTTAEFQRDVLLMLSNALMYNSSDHRVHHMAQEMHQEAESQLGMLLAAQAHAGLSEAPVRRTPHKRRAPAQPTPNKRRHD